MNSTHAFTYDITCTRVYAIFFYCTRVPSTRTFDCCLSRLYYFIAYHFPVFIDDVNITTWASFLCAHFSIIPCYWIECIDFTGVYTRAVLEVIWTVNTYLRLCDSCAAARTDNNVHVRRYKINKNHGGFNFNDTFKTFPCIPDIAQRPTNLIKCSFFQNIIFYRGWPRHSTVEIFPFT